MKESCIRIKRVGAEYIPDIAKCERECFSDASGEKAIKTLFDMGAVAVAALSDSTLCGFAYAADCAGDAELLRICVKDDFRKQGIGRRLLSALHTELEREGTACVFLEVRESNNSAISLYLSEGYFQTGRRKGFYKAPAEDALLFTKEL